ncbi:protein ABHD11 [Aplysia californica]|uniref:sn-1-specific diacylglycerol lipase ABHD11 n=1 Tax=Aplysia californica TaxID=6500 RepID=A0ABM0JL94_APLCA|nr:protein ABHD11 [Aplysia californica]
MLHGLFGARGNFHSICKQLSQNGRKIVPYDARNHGDSDHRPEMNYSVMAEDLLGLMADLKLDRPVVLGHSMGGKSAMTAALRQPDALTALIVADVAPNPSPHMSRMTDYAEAMRNVKLPEHLSVVKARAEARLQLSSVVQDRMVREFLLTNLREFAPQQIGWRINLDAIIDHMDELARMPGLDSEPFTKPTLFIFGGDSDHYKNADFGLIKALFPAVHTEVIPGANHFLHADKPLEFVEIVNNFVRDLDDSQ